MRITQFLKTGKAGNFRILYNERATGGEEMQGRNIGVDIVSFEPVDKNHKEQVIKFAKSLSPKYFFPDKTTVKFVGSFPTNIIRISLHIARTASSEEAVEYLTTELHRLIKKDWIKEIEINQVNMVVENIDRIIKQVKPDYSDILTTLEYKVQELRKFYEDKGRTTKFADEWNKMVDAAEALILALKL